MKRTLALLALLLVPVPACGAPRAEAMPNVASPAAYPGAAAESAPARMPSMPGAPAPAMPAMAGAPGREAPPMKAGASAASSATTSSSVPAATVAAPMVTYTGEMALRVDRDPSATIDAVIAAAEALGGYLASRRDASVEVRVPSARFREAMSKVDALGDVTHRAVAANDVSDEYHDAEVRLANLRATRARLQELLSRAGSLADTLTVERELERVAQEIDRLEGRLAYLKARVAFSTLAVSVEARPKTAPVIVARGPKRVVDLPVKWLDEMGTDRLLTLR